MISQVYIPPSIKYLGPTTHPVPKPDSHLSNYDFTSGCRP